MASSRNVTSSSDNLDTDNRRDNQNNSCRDCNIKFESSTSLTVHLQYHNQNLLTKWAAEARLEGTATCPVPTSPPDPASVSSVTPLLVKSDPVTTPPQLGPGSVESRRAVAAVSSSAGPCRPASSMQISMAQSMGLQQGAPPHLTTHHSSPIFSSPVGPGQQEQSPADNTPGLPSINNDVSEFFSHLESRPVQLDTYSSNSVATKSPRYHPYNETRSNNSAMTNTQFVSYQSPFPDTYQSSHGFLETFTPGSDHQQTHDQSSEEIWDLDSQTVKRYNPGPDPVSPGPIPTTPTMYGSSHQLQLQKSGANWDQSSNMYSPYDTMARAPGIPPQSLSPGLVGPWMGSINIKSHGVPDSKRPKSYQCEPCDKWFTSSGHLKRHYNTTLHKNAMKQKGDGYIDGMNGGSLSIPSVESHGAPSPCLSLGEESSQSSVCDDQSTQSSQVSSVSGPSSSINILNHGSTSQQDSSSPPANTSPNVPRPSPRNQQLLLSPPVAGASPASSPLGGITQLAAGVATIGDTVSIPQTLVAASSTASQLPMAVSQTMSQSLVTIPPAAQVGVVPQPPQQHLVGVPPSTPQPVLASNSTMSAGNGIPSSPSSRNLAASPAAQQPPNVSNRFSPFRSGPPNNPSYKVQNLDNAYPSYHSTFHAIQTPQHQVTQTQFNGDSYLGSQSVGNSPYRHNVVVSEQYQSGQYPGQYPYQTMIQYSSSPNYDIANHGSYIPQSFPPSDISGYGQLSTNEGMSGIFPANIRTMKPAGDERDSPEGSDGSEISLKNEAGQFRCNECNKVFNRVCYLKQHNKSFHNGEKPFKCSQCGKRFPVEVLYQEHLSKHAGDKPYKCEVCPKQFNHKTDLRRHMCLHTGEKPFTCDVCGKGFIREDRMVKHADTHKKKAAHVTGGLM